MTVHLWQVNHGGMNFTREEGTHNWLRTPTARDLYNGNDYSESRMSKREGGGIGYHVGSHRCRKGHVGTTCWWSMPGRGGEVTRQHNMLIKQNATEPSGGPATVIPLPVFAWCNQSISPSQQINKMYKNLTQHFIVLTTFISVVRGLLQFNVLINILSLYKLVISDLKSK